MCYDCLKREVRLSLASRYYQVDSQITTQWAYDGRAASTTQWAYDGRAESTTQWA